MNTQRPICINPGCGEPVTWIRKDKQGNRRWRVHCSPCQRASYGAGPLAPGVKSFKTGRCTNTDAHLGFECPVDWTVLPAWAKGITEIDHRDGNAYNNDPHNLDELCSICHKLKGIQNGDFNNQRKSALPGNTMMLGSKFSDLFECY